MRALEQFRTGIPSVREAIIAILAEDFPLTVAQLKRTIYRRYGLRVSYQAIHKEACRLIDQQILQREERLLQLCADWIACQQEFFRGAYRKYLGPQAPR